MNHAIAREAIAGAIGVLIAFGVVAVIVSHAINRFSRKNDRKH